jgi:hypothetical protein
MQEFSNLWADMNIRAQIAGSLVLIACFLALITYKLYNQHPKSIKKK